MQRLAGTQAQLLGIGVEIVLEVGQGNTVGVLVVDTQTAAYIDVLNADAVAFQLVLQLIDAIAECFEVAHVENLAANVEV